MVSRIKQLLDWQQLSPTQFADRIGVGRPVVSHILSERNKPSLDVARSIKAAFPELSYDWLLEGSGEMLAATPGTGIAAAPTPLAAAMPVVQVSSPVSAAPMPAVAPVPEAVPQPAVVPAPLARPAAGTTAGLPMARFQAAKSAPAVNQPVSTAIPAPPLTTAAASSPEPPVATPTQPVPAVIVAETPPAGLATTPAASPAASAAPATEAAVLAASLAGQEKAIRRIVIFYRDGSFADYQPEG